MTPAQARVILHEIPQPTCGGNCDECDARMTLRREARAVLAPSTERRPGPDPTQGQRF